MEFKEKLPSKTVRGLKRPAASHPIASCVLATVLCIGMSQSHAWYDDYQSCMSAVESNCRYTDFYLDYFPVHEHQYPDYGQCVEMGVQVEGCNSLQTNRPSGNVSNAPRETVIVVGSPSAAPLPPIIAAGPYQPDISSDVPIVVAPLPSTGSQPDERDQKEKGMEECLADSALEFSLCEQSAHASHLTQYNLCEAVSWSGWLLSVISRGRLGAMPDTCGSKLELKKELDLAKCGTNHEVNKKLCGL
jgi:hypothetical protein